MRLHGIFPDHVAPDAALIATLADDQMVRYRAVPDTVMINRWQDDLRWLAVDSSYPGQIARRRAILLDKRDKVVDRLPGSEVRAAERELRDAVAASLLADWPRYFRRDGDRLVSLLTGFAVDLGEEGADPLHAIALMASEDMLLLMPEQGAADPAPRYVLKSGALLFPNDWSLRSHFAQAEPDRSDAATWNAWDERRRASLRAARLGRTPREIHEGHVAHYVTHFADRVDRYFARMAPGSPSWRRNWGMRMTGELCLHFDESTPGPEASAANWEAFGYLRSEHETFVKLPESGAVAFGIKTFLWKLDALVKNPVALQALLEADARLAPQMAAYRAAQLPSFRQFLARYRTG
ncbi:MAG TPA: DUF3445 domain-containing protein [Noviherbaspirillum sp.]|uniref:heme-dependent oxidative N-demethylase family protein n=1 Tax=Noviherbaspirillum sp. TaxID=1926288 RepID=UPI002F9539ED